MIFLMMKMKYKYSRETVALFAALCIFLSTIEYMIPKPVPFLRLGLANLPLIISIAVFSPRDIFLLVILKAVGQGFINGTLFSYIFLFSAAGSLVSGLVMLGVFYLFGRRISLIGVSIFGALGSNMIQLYLSKVFIFGSAVKYIAPPFLITGFVTSLVLGFFASEFFYRSRWLKAAEYGV